MFHDFPGFSSAQQPCKFLSQKFTLNKKDWCLKIGIICLEPETALK